MIRYQFTASIALLGMAGNLHAAVINVPADFASVQQAVNAAVNGDEIVVAPGAYPGFNFNGKAVTVRSTDLNNPALTTLNGGGAGTVVLFNSMEGPDSRLLGFTIINGAAASGGGVNIGMLANPTIENCVFTANQAQIGGGLWSISGGTLRECMFIGNVANNSGGGLSGASGSNLKLDACRFEGNDAPTGAAMQLAFAATVVNTEVFDNVGGVAVAIGGNAAVSLINCNVVNHATTGVAVSGAATVPVTIANCIVRNNPAQFTGPAAMINVRYSNVQGGFAGAGNIDVAPQFVDPAFDNFQLLPTSPCIDAGDNAALSTNIIEDFGGFDRRSDRSSVADTGAGTAPIVDIGAHEFAPPRRYVNADAAGLDHGKSWSNAYLDLQDALQDATVVGSEITEIWVAKGTYWPDGGTGDRTRSFNMLSDVEIIGGFAGGETSSSLNDPLAHPTILSGAIGAPGDADNSYHVVRATIVDADGKLIGFTLQRGNASAAVGADSFGGGICIEGGAPVIRECWVRNCIANNSGGGLFCVGGDPNIVRCRFSLNDAMQGGGLSFWGGEAQVLNCVVSGNHADDDGGAMHIVTPAVTTITNCTIIANTSTNNSGGGLVVSGDLTANNNILWQNVGTVGTVEAQQLRISGGGAIDVNHSTVQGWSGVLGGSANLATNPGLIDANGVDNLPGTADDDPRPEPGSSSIDSGDGSALTAFVTVDYDGNPRYFDDYTLVNTGAGSPAYVDRGAFEFQSVSCVGEVLVNGAVDVNDLLAVITGWGNCPAPCPPRCNSDIAPSPSGDCAVNVNDLLLVITHWGACP